ncbi:CotO family spore coat protein [Lentibacillus amyloliquefaciens]|uniref:Spore coat protein CotO n=1 Tax=Lentibacillus amyloliquefaciens TaxID=1472767 RepID=A0A0U4EZC2_9BACI|nr:CotO family spore coat protein [Lentibacillus amyloliquefaciens]ALX48615.1 hypothetical protein AOX59_08335 [Lentibacillus amyloliquefaciens]
MGDHKNAKSPLLYIHQPHIKSPKASMQSHYMTPKKQNDTTAQSNKKRIGTRHHFNKSKDYDEEDIAYSKESDEAQEEEDQDPEEKKKFKEMTLEERVNYFLDTPEYAPVMKCEVKTDGRNYRGLIVDYQDDHVYMRVGRRTTPTSIPFDTIKEIKLLGF